MTCRERPPQRTKLCPRKGDFVMPRRTRERLSALLAGALTLIGFGTVAVAQPTTSDTAVPAAQSAGGSTVPQATPQVGTTTTQSVPIIVQVPPSAATVGSTSVTLPDVNQSLPSSSRPTSDASAFGDSFDLNRGSQGTPVVRGNRGSFAIVGDRAVGAVAVPDIHTVRRGDTLFGLCGHYYSDPYAWPKVWSYNPEIRNPNWIYPGDQLRLRSEDEAGRTPVASTRALAGPRRDRGTLVERGAVVGPDTIFLRNDGYIDDPDKDTLGEVVGAREEQMMLSQGNRVYLDVKPGTELRPGQELTLFEPVRKLDKVAGARQPPGEIVALKGTVHIADFDPKKRLATGEIVESADVIERGTKVGIVARRHLVVPPKPSRVTVWARVLSGIYPNVYFGQHQVVFIDRGSEDGLEAGNRLVVVRRGDTWRQSLSTTTRAARDRVRVDVEEHVVVQPTELRRDDPDFPEEIVAELRIVETHRFSSVVIVTDSAREVMSGDRAVARESY